MVQDQGCVFILGWIPVERVDTGIALVERFLVSGYVSKQNRSEQNLIESSMSDDGNMVMIEIFPETLQASRDPFFYK